jgi:putative flippase GtrA
VTRFDDLVSGVRFGQFASVGALGAVVDTTVTVLLASQFGIFRGAAKLAGAELAIVVMFLVNEHWTFGDHGNEGLRAVTWRFLKSNLVRVGGVLVATGVFVAVSGLPNPFVTYGLPNPTPLGRFEAWLVVANGVGILAGLAVNYVLESVVTWRLVDR